MTTKWITQRTFWVFDLDGTLTVPVHDFAAIKRELGLDPEVDILSAWLPCQTAIGKIGLWFLTP